MSAEEIKSCPFCGGIAEYDDNITEHYGLDSPGVACQGCGVRNFCRTKEEAISSWNGRITEE